MSRYEDQLRLQVAADEDPALSSNEIQTLIDMFPVKAIYKLWKPSTAYNVGDKVLPTPRSGDVFVVTTAGTSGTEQPRWQDLPLTTTDNGIVWEINPDLYDVPFNMKRATAEGWRIKAGKVANRVDFKTDVTTISRDQLYKHCIDMFKQYSRGINMIVISPLGRNFEVPPALPLPVIGNR